MSALYKWILINEATRESYQLQAPHPDPAGWEEMGMKLYRSEKYHGVFLEPSTKQFGFYADGGGQEFIETMRSTYDVNAELTIICLHRPNSDVEYTEMFRHRLDMLSYMKEKRIVYLNIEDSNLYSKVEARMDIPVDLETTTSIGEETITAISTETISLPGQAIRLNSEWQIANGYSSSNGVSFTIAKDQVGYFTPVGELVSSDFAITNVLPGIQQFDDENIDTRINSNDSVFPPILQLANSGFNFPITMNYEIDFNGTWDNIETTTLGVRDFYRLRLQLVYGKRTDPVTAPTFITLYDYNTTTTSDITNEPFSVNTSGSFSLNVGESVWLVWFLEVHSTGLCTCVHNFDYTASSFKLYADTQAAATDCKTVLVHEAFNQVVDAMADADGKFYSELYGRTDSEKQTYAGNGEGAFKAITSGNALRQRDVPIVLSFNSLFDSANAIDNIGMGLVAGKVRIEKYEHWYNPYTRIIRIANVREIKTEISTPHYFNHIKLGFKKFEAETTGGLDEPNTSTEWSTSVHFLNNKYHRESDLIGSSYAMEITRRKGISLTTEDWRFDNDNFWICLNSDKTVELADDFLDTHSGMQAGDTAYNLRITPARMLQAHFRNIVAGLQTIGGFLKFITKAGNRDLATETTATTGHADYSGASLTENASLAYNDAQVDKYAPIITPLIDTFETSITFQDFITIRDAFTEDTADSYGYIEYYETESDIRRGFLMEMNYKLLNGKTTFKILRRYVNTLS